jgi:hypothetical protein
MRSIPSALERARRRGATTPTGAPLWPPFVAGGCGGTTVGSASTTIRLIGGGSRGGVLTRASGAGGPT